MNNNEIRNAIVEALPNDTSLHGKTPKLNKVYLPSDHTRALRLDCSLVIGARGTGKTFWSSALNSPQILELLGEEIPDLSKADVYTGFSEKSEISDYPDAGTFEHMLANDIDPRHIWRAVIARWASRIINIKDMPCGKWNNTVKWVIDNPDEFAGLMEKLNKKYAAENKFGLIVFDAIDRTASNWLLMNKITKGLLEVSLYIKTFSNLFSKVFLRDDQFKSNVTNFPDASKLNATSVELLWGIKDLYGLLWHYLCNADGEDGKLLRDFFNKNGGELKKSSNIYMISPKSKKEDTLKPLFSALAGQWMGSDKRRGNTYTWCVAHLGDRDAKTSPRSFIAALRKAASYSLDKYQDYKYPLHYESIKQGVREASQIRIEELTEDYPWVEEVMRPLKGLVVPCAFSDFTKKWDAHFENKHPNKIIWKNKDRLPPESCEDGWKGILQDLKSLGILDISRDGRINMPDLYRVGYGIGRRGGITPKARENL